MLSINRSVGQRIIYYRKKNCLYQYKLAAMVGLRKESLSHIERGRAIPSIPTLMRIAAALDISLKELLEE